ncbi:MAG TPA: UDP-N-acetylmuramoyl-L-alanyl-D-glutamate--2,6-diaminopimelate ligase [Candidatus Pacearchaeota archaeon]|nr:UDP-N-acetylmuramoyl-L-alanyl-D-glutamate--2,6-diaminopimelate ligase [Candidatus Pacearchaeota archaeon]HPO68215.1 UDP-N-acetylmuramoyl-L-alanyl-D-glutamate--2,6-diaminopimelate ligase [Candidatus Pacearchaeota archaeon]
MKNLIKKIIPPFLLNFYHFSLAFLGALIYGFPSRNLIVIGITGTSGKTTTAELTIKILEEYLKEKKSNQKVALASSIKFKIGENEEENKLKMTMPGRFTLQKFLKKAVKNNCKYAVLEVTSEGIKQYRHKFIKFDVALLTNLSPEHIESHKGFENYKKAKGKLFEETKNIHIINIDDKNADYFLKFPARKKYTFGLNQGDINNKDLNLNLLIPGDFNIYNALAAICIAFSQNIDIEFSKKVVENFKGIPGRMEVVIEKPFKVVVDYAITPVSLEKVYKTLISDFKNKDSKLICVLGSCGGGRDKWKRPVLGEIAYKYCDNIIITNEDPYDEDPLKIIDDVAKGAKEKAQKILDRKEAIKTAIKLAKENDTIIITGKGCEPLMCLANGKKIPWDDRKIVKEEFKKNQKQLNGKI